MSGLYLIIDSKEIFICILRGRMIVFVNIFGFLILVEFSCWLLFYDSIKLVDLGIYGYLVLDLGCEVY